MHITALIMCRDEEDTIEKTLHSLQSHVNRILLYDTGSVDDTEKVCRDFAVTLPPEISFDFKSGPWIDFATSRNASLDWAESFDDAQWILVLDSNDELRGGEELRRGLAKTSHSALHVARHLKMRDDVVKFKAIRLYDSSHREKWRFVGVVHEYLTCITDSNVLGGAPLNDVVLWQDREPDLRKSASRFSWDRKVLQKQIDEGTADARTHFYLGQTCLMLDLKEDALKAFEKRCAMEGFAPEGYRARLHCGDLCWRLQRIEQALLWYLRATVFAEERMQQLRAEGLHACAFVLKKIGVPKCARVFAQGACDAPMLHENVDGSFNNKLYHRERFELLQSLVDEKRQNGDDEKRRS